jgi:hypothetical protein
MLALYVLISGNMKLRGNHLNLGFILAAYKKGYVIFSSLPIHLPMTKKKNPIAIPIFTFHRVRLCQENMNHFCHPRYCTQN